MRTFVRATGLTVLLLVAATCALAQQPQQPRQPVANESSVTLAQIVQRQDANFARIKQAEGQVIWTEQIAGQPPTSSSTRLLLFAFAGDRSVNLISAWDPSGRSPAKGEKMDWSRILAAFFLEGERVHKITMAPGAKVAAIETTGFNPAVHENNPLVAFHPRMLGEERVRLRDLVELTPQMKTRPVVRDLQRAGRALLQIDFYNEKKTGESITYVVAPDKGYLTEEIVRTSGGKVVARTNVTIGQTKDKTWIPARRVKQEYDAAGRVTTREIWYYLYLAVNEPLARRILSFEFFHLPPGTQTPAVSPQASTAVTATPRPSRTPDPRLGPSPTPIGPMIRPR